MSVQKATECYQLLWCLQHLWEIMPSSKNCGRSWILAHQYPQTENQMQEYQAQGKTTVKRKLAAHQNAVCWSLPAQSMRQRNEQELLDKGAKLLLKEQLSLVVTFHGVLDHWYNTQLLRSRLCPHDCNCNTSICLVIFFFGAMQPRNKASLPRLNK